MGSSASKPARAAANAARRQYPKQPTSPTTAPPTGPKPQAQQSPPPPPPKQPTPKTHSHGPVYHSKEQPSSVKSDAIDLDARDPHFAASLRSIGPVTPAPTLSHSSTFNAPQAQHPNRQPHQTVFPQTSNPALLVITARQRVAKAAEQEAEEFGKQSHTGREYLDVLTIRQALAMRDHNRLPEQEIERVLRLKKGVMERFGGKGVVGEIR